MYPNSSLVYKLTPAIGVFGTGASLVEPPSGTYSTGYVPGQSFPAQHENWFMNYLSSDDIMTQNAYTNTLEELNTVLSNAGITPSSGATNQLYTAFTNGSLNLNLLGATLGADQLNNVFSLATGTDLRTLTHTGFFSVQSPTNGPPGSTGTFCFVSNYSTSGSSRIKQCVDILYGPGLYTRWETSFSSGTWGTWTTNAIVTPGSSQGAGWSNDLVQDVSTVNNTFSGAAGNWLTLFRSTDMPSCVSTCLFEFSYVDRTSLNVIGTFVLTFGGTLAGGNGSAKISQLQCLTTGPLTVAISWDGTYYYISLSIPHSGSATVSARITPLTITTVKQWNLDFNQAGGLSSTNVSWPVTNTGTAPAPMTGQTHSLGNLSANVTLPACNLYETHYANFYEVATAYNAYLPSTGTYQFIVYFSGTSASSNALCNTEEAAGGALVTISAAPTQAWIVIYRRIA